MTGLLALLASCCPAAKSTFCGRRRCSPVVAKPSILSCCRWGVPAKFSLSPSTAGTLGSSCAPRPITAAACACKEKLLAVLERDRWCQEQPI